MPKSFTPTGNYAQNRAYKELCAPRTKKRREARQTKRAAKNAKPKGGAQ